MTASIDLLGVLWDTSVIPWFYGSFDGDGHTISHLTVAGSDHVGLFGRSYGEVVNLGVVDVNVVGSGDYVGALVGEKSYGTVTDCYSTGSVIAVSDVGGLVGYNNHGEVTQCYSTVTVIGTGWSVGGLVGCNSEGAVAQCYSEAAVSGRGSVGGLVGNNRSDYDEATVTQCYSTGAVSGSSDVGGLVGCNNGIVTQCYSAGAVGANDRVGGAVGSNKGRHVWYSPTWVWVDSIVGNCFWDIQTSGQVTSDGGTGKTTAEMQTASTFLDAGWDFVGETANGTEDIWWILEGKDYPRLWWEAAEEPSP